VWCYPAQKHAVSTPEMLSLYSEYLETILSWESGFFAGLFERRNDALRAGAGSPACLLHVPQGGGSRGRFICGFFFKKGLQATICPSHHLIKKTTKTLLCCFLLCRASPSWWKPHTSGRDGAAPAAAGVRAPRRRHREAPGPGTGGNENLRGDGCL